MSGTLKSAATLATLGVVLLVAAVVGWQAFTQPLPGEEEVPLCVDREVSAGTELVRDQVVVSVFNGSRRSGLAAATMETFTERGFIEGDIGDAPVQTRRTQVWAEDKTNPAVQLVRRQIKGARIVAPQDGQSLGTGVVVVVGENHQGLRAKQVESVVAETDATVCTTYAAE